MNITIGTVHSPWECYVRTVSGNNVWLYGGFTDRTDFYILHHLDICLLIWTQIQTGFMPKSPGGLYKRSSSLNMTRDNQLAAIAHYGYSAQISRFEDTWILNLSTYPWKKHIYDNSFRFNHTGALGINKLEPKSLQQLAIKTVH